MGVPGSGSWRKESDLADPPPGVGARRDAPYKETHRGSVGSGDLRLAIRKERKW